MDKFDFKLLKVIIGEKLEDIKDNLPEGYKSIREVRKDGNEIGITADFHDDRINVNTKEGIIIGIDGFY